MNRKKIKKTRPHPDYHHALHRLSFVANEIDQRKKDVEVLLEVGFMYLYGKNQRKVNDWSCRDAAQRPPGSN